MRRILEEVGEEHMTPTIIKCDNQSSIKLTNNPVYHARSKHIETHYHFVRKKMESREINIVYCNTNENMADIFTKPLGKTKYELFRCKLGVLENKLLH
jgi:hypothetical protein